MTEADQPDWGNREKTYSREVRDHMRRVLEADVVVAVFPVYWQSVPAVLKGWIDRVWNYGFAYGRSKPRLAGKRMLWLALAGAAADDPVTEGMHSLLEANLSEGIAYYCGFSHSQVGLLPDAEDRPQRVDARATCWSATRSRAPSARPSTPISTVGRGVRGEVPRPRGGGGLSAGSPPRAGSGAARQQRHHPAAVAASRAAVNGRSLSPVMRKGSPVRVRWVPPASSTRSRPAAWSQAASQLNAVASNSPRATARYSRPAEPQGRGATPGARRPSRACFCSSVV